MLNNDKLSLKILFIACIGSGLEMYDFIVYVFFAPLLAEQFFPLQNSWVALLLTLCVFAVGYLSRALGAFLFGHIADTLGRKKSLYYTITAMAIPILLITILPTYKTIGILAPILLTILRAIQGLAVGGEFSGAVTLVYEQAPQNKKNIYCAAVIFALNIGILTAILIATSIQHYFIQERHLEWGWRIAFFIGAILAIVGAYIRNYAHESSVFQQLLEHQTKSEAPVIKLIKYHGITLLRLIFIASGAAMAVGMIVFLPIYLKLFTHLTTDEAFIGNVIFLIILCICILITGGIADRINSNAKTLGVGLAVIAALTFPLGILLTDAQNYSSVVMACMGLAIPLGMILGSFSSYLAQNFNVDVRATGVGLSYNIPFTLITGTFPALSIYVIKISGHTGFQYTYVLILALFALSHLLVTRSANN